MPEIYEVVFVDKIVGNDRKVIVEDFNLGGSSLQTIANRAKRKLCKYLACQSSDLVFRSLRVL